MQIRKEKRGGVKLTSFLVPFPVDIGNGVVRSMSASISEMSSVENPFVIVVSPVFELLNCPVTLPCSLLSSFGCRRLIKSHRTAMMSKQTMTPDVAEMINNK